MSTQLNDNADVHPSIPEELVATVNVPESADGPDEDEVERFSDVAVFAREYDLHPAFIPFDRRDYDPVAVLRVVGDVVRAVPSTGKYISRRKVVNYIEKDPGTYGFDEAPNPSRLPAVFFLIHHAYPCPGAKSEMLAASTANERNRTTLPSGHTGVVDSGSQHVRFANPTYPNHQQLPSVTDPDAREAWLHYYAGLGFHEYHDILNHFGVKAESSVKSFVLRRDDFEWQPIKDRGIDRMARTWKLLNEWGYSRQEIATAFGTTHSSVKHHIKRRADDFDVPDDPTTNQPVPQTSRTTADL